MTLKTAAFDLDVKAKNDGSFSGYGSVFGNVDSYGEIVRKGAFSRSLGELAQRDRKLPVLWQHNSGEPLGVYDVLREDDRGLYVEGRLLARSVAKAKEAHALMEAGAITGLSIGYRVVKAQPGPERGQRTLTDLDLKEISLVTFPANDEARVLRAEAVETERDFERLLREAGFARTAAARLAKGGWGALSTQANPRHHDLAARIHAAANSLRTER
jgi:hypothetical protein